MNKKLILVFVGVFILVALFFANSQKISTPSSSTNLGSSVPNQSSIPPKTPPNTSSNPSLERSNISLSFDFGGGAEKISQSIDFKKGENLLDAMIQINLKIETKTYAGLGSIIESINDFKSGTDGKYWQYWVNGKYSQVGASAYKIQPGDVVEWRFTNENPN